MVGCPESVVKRLWSVMLEDGGEIVYHLSLRDVVTEERKAMRHAGVERGDSWRILLCVSIFSELRTLEKRGGSEVDCARERMGGVDGIFQGVAYVYCYCL